MVPKEDSHSSRCYQDFFVQLGKKQNIIVCLPTGSGKTWIAIQLAKEYLQETIEQGKKIIVIACTVALTKQHFDSFRENLPDVRPATAPEQGNGDKSNGNRKEKETIHTVDYLSSDRDVDSWELPKWNSFLGNCHVIVMTPETLVRALTHNFMDITEISLLVMDECHHTDKKHPMNQIMNSYHEYLKDHGRADLPRILGLTATIINGKKTSNSVENEVKEVEKRLDARASTYWQYEEVLKHSTNSAVIYDRIAMASSKYSWSSQEDLIKAELMEFWKLVEAQDKSHFKSGRTEEVNHPSYSPDRVYIRKKGELEKFKSIVSDVLKVYEELGPYCAAYAARNKRVFIQLLENITNPKVKEFYSKLTDALTKFEENITQIMSSKTEAERVPYFITKKLQRLLEILGEYGPPNAESLCGIVFVKQRLTAQVLSWFLEDYASLVPEGNFIKANFVIGSANNEMDARETQVSIKKQTEILRGFRQKQYNVLVATNVIEEGLDVPICSLIVRFDEIQNYPSYIQSMGRARDRNSKFIAFISCEKDVETYERFQRFNASLSDYLKEKALHPFQDDEDDDSPISAFNGIPDFAPYGVRTPAITASQAIAIVHQYCQSLATDRYASFLPISWHATVGTEFKAWVQLPTNSVVREVTEGDAQKSKSLAKSSAFLKVCEQLFYRGALNPDTLLPHPSSHNAALLAMIKSLSDGIETDTSGKKVGSKKRTQRYLKKIPDCLKESIVGPRTKCRIFQLVVEQEPKLDDLVSSSLYRFTERLSSFGLLVPADLDLSMIPKFFLHVNPAIGFLTVSLNPVKELVDSEDKSGFLSLSQTGIRKLEDFERFIYGDLLQLKSVIMEKASAAPSMLLVPLKREPGFSSNRLGIQFDLIDRVLKLQEEPQDFWSTVPLTRTEKIDSTPYYGDALVVPWHKVGGDPELFAVVDVLESSSPKTEFPNLRPEQGQITYKDYFLQKYSAKVQSIQDEDQPLLRVKKIRNNLNFFTKQVTNRKRREEDDSQIVIELIPELTRIHPLPASLYIQAKLLPSIMQRISRLLLAHEIKMKVSGGPHQLVGEQLKKSPFSSILSMSCKSRLMSIMSFEEERRFHKMEVNSDGVDDGECSSDSEMKSQVSNSVKRPKLEEDLELRLDFIHPREYNNTPELLDLAQKIRARKMAMKPFEDSNRLQQSHVLIDVHSSSLTSLKKYDSDFESISSSSNNVAQPSLFSLMQAITLNESRDFVSLERLETIGDSFLKLAVTKFLYTNYLDLNEGRMSEMKSFLVSNAHLYGLGKKAFGLGEYLASGVFVPECAWLPPGFTVPPNMVQAAARHDVNDDIFLVDQDFTDTCLARWEDCSDEDLDDWIAGKKRKLDEFAKNNKKRQPDNIGYVYGRVGDKSVADCVEALLGAYYLAGGPAGAYQFLDKLGLQGPTRKVKTDENQTPVKPVQGQKRTIEEDKINLDWISIKNCPPLTSYDFIAPHENSVGSFLPEYKALEKLIAYTFKEPWLLVQAFSHPCYTANRTTPPYERLEFIGDAILDFLITDHIFARGNLSPGQLTDLRSALVNNVTFGSLTVRYGLDKFLLASEAVKNAYRDFVVYQTDNDHKVTGHFKLTEYESPLIEDVDVPKILGDLWESLAGAIFLDSGYSLDTVWRVFYRLMKNEIDLFSRNVPQSPLKRIHERFPEARDLFTDVSEEWQKKPGMDEKLTYMRLNLPKSVKHDRGEIVGMGKNKRSAKVGAAKYAVKILDDADQ